MIFFIVAVIFKSKILKKFSTDVKGMVKLPASAMHAQASTTEHGASWILCIASSYALFFSYFYVLRKVNGRCRYFCEVILCIVCPSTFHPVRLLYSTLSLFSQNGQAVRMQTMQRCRAHFPGSTSWSLFLPSSYEALRCYYFLCEEWETTVFFPPLLFFPLVLTPNRAGHSLLYETWRLLQGFSLSLSLPFSKMNFLLLTTELSIRRGFQKGV